MGMLAAAMTLGAALAPPGIRHQHASGDRNHSHRNHASLPREIAHTEHDHGHGTHARHRAEHSHRHAPDARAPAQTLVDAPWHVHVVLFGYTATLPDPRPQDDGGHSPGQPVFVTLQGYELPVLLDASNLLVLERPQAVLAPNSCDVVARRHPLPDTAPPEGLILLCDGARRERTGVLLA